MKLSQLLRSAIGLSILAAITVACNNGSYPNEDFAIGNKPIVFSSNIASSPLRVQDNAWEAGDLIGVYMVANGKTIAEATAPELYYSNVVYKAAQKGEKVAFEAASEADKMHFPTQGNKVDFVAFYPQSLPVNAAKSIELNTTTQPAADLLYANNLKGMSRTATANNLVMNFAHMQAAIRFTLQTPEGKIVSDATITLKGLKTKAVFNLTNGTLSNMSTPADMQLIAKENRHDGIVLPQKLATNAAQAVILHGGKSYTWNIPQMTFEPNKRVSYMLKLSAEGGVKEVGLGGTITDWTDVDGGSHTIAPDEPDGETTPSSALVLAEIFPTGTLTPDGKQFDDDKYLLIHNQSDDIVYLDGICISTSPFLGNLKIKPIPDIANEATLADAILQVPGNGQDYPLAPHTSALFVDNAANHLKENPLSWDANKADFEFFWAGPHDDIDNPKVPNMLVRYSYIVMNNQASQTFFIWRLPKGMSMEQYLQKYRHYFYWMFVQGDIKVKMEENEYKVPNEWIYDAVNLAPYSEFEWVTTAHTLDCSYTFCADIGLSEDRYRYAVRRKVGKETSTGIIYIDNNDSANDFYSRVKASKLSQP